MKTKQQKKPKQHQPKPAEPVSASMGEAEYLPYLHQLLIAAKHQGEVDRKGFLEGLIVSTTNPSQQTPLAALNCLVIAGLAGVVAPAWAVQMVDEGMRQRLKDPATSLDKIFGYAAEGRGKTSEARQILYDMRNAKVVTRIHLMMLSGKYADLEAACNVMANKLKEMKNWNQTGYDLSFLRDGTTDPVAMGDRLVQLYEEWKRTRSTEELAVFDTLAKSPDLFSLILNDL